MDSDGKAFGEAQLLASIGQGRSELLDDNVVGLADSIVRWRGVETPQDDISILAVEFSGPAEMIRQQGAGLSTATCGDENMKTEPSEMVEAIL